MDHCNIPSCALNRQVTTVIIRNKMDVSDTHCHFEGCPNSGRPKVLHRPSGCEKCQRTRLNNQFSDCDSGLVGKYRTYKSRAARSRYVNVCAVVCLLLLVGGLSPRSSAAPYRSRTMDRQKRGTDQENSLWGNPCNYTQSNSKSVYTPKYAEKILRQAAFTLSEAEKYKDEFASKLFSMQNFDELSRDLTEIHYIRTQPWFREEVLPKEKVLGQKMSDDAMSELMKKIDEVLPSMYKGLKMVVAGLYVFTESLSKYNFRTDANVVDSLNRTVSQVRSVLCVFYDLMVSRNLRIEPLYDSEIPELNEGDVWTEGFAIYRDTLTYLDYLKQVFEAMANTDLSAAA